MEIRQIGAMPDSSESDENERLTSETLNCIVNECDVLCGKGKKSFKHRKL